MHLVLWLFLNKSSLETMTGTSQIPRLTSILDSLLHVSYLREGNVYGLRASVAPSFVTFVSHHFPAASFNG